MSDGRVVIDVSLNHDTVRSDAHIIEQLLNSIGRNAGQTMDESFRRNTASMSQQARQASSTIQNELNRPVEIRVNLQDNASSHASQAFRTISSEADNARSHVSSFKDVFSGTFMANIAMGGIHLVKEGITELIKTGVEYNAVQDKMSAVWGVLTGSASKGKEMVNMVNDFQKATGYATETLNEMEQKIYHIKGSASETKEMTKAFTTLGDAMGLSDDKLLGVSEQFAQMMSNGKAYAGDLNVMTNAFPAFGDALVEHLHKPMGEIRKMASLGKLSAKDVEDTLLDMQKKYAGATEAVMGTTQGLWRAMQSNYDRLAGAFAKPIFNMKKSGFKDLADWLASKDADKFFTNLGTQVANAVGKVTDFIGFLNKHRDTIIRFGTAFSVLAVSIMAVKKVSSIVGDIGLVVSGLGRLRTGYAQTAEASTAMTNSAISDAERLALAQSGGAVVGSRVANNARPSTGSRVGATLGAVASGASIVGMGLTMTGTKAGMIAGTIMTFLPTILQLGKVLFDVGKTVFTFVRTFASMESIIALASNPVGWVVAGIIALGTAFYECYKHIKPFHDWVDKTASKLKGDFFSAVKTVQGVFKPLIDTTVEWGDKVPKSTKKALDAYVKVADTASRKLEDLVVSGKKVSAQDVDKLVAPYKEMAKQITKHFDDTQSKVAKGFEGLKKTNKQEYDDILKQTSQANESRKSTVNATEKAIEDIYKKASKEKRGITADEQQKINGLQDTMNKQAVASMSHSQKEQEMILGKLRDHTGKISADQASEIVKNAKKQETETIKSADKTYKDAVKSANSKYKDVTDLADQEYYVNHTISKKQYDDIVKNAKDTKDNAINDAKKKRDGVVNHATDEFDQTVDLAKKQAGGYADQIDWQTGHVLSKWDELKTNTLNTVNAILGFFGLPKISDHSAPSVAKAIKTERAVGFSTLHGGGGHNMSAFANGTDNFHEGGLALVGDGTGNNAGSEAIITPDGKLHFSPANPTVMNLPKGTQVLPAHMTKKMFDNVPHYAFGVGDIVGKIGGWLGKGADYIFSQTAHAFGVDGISSALSKFGSTFTHMGGGALNKVLKSGAEWVQKKMDSWFSFGDSGSAPKGKVSGNVMQWLQQAMSITGVPSQYLNALATLVQHESGGNPHAVNNWDSNAKAGHPSKGLFQTIDSTFNRYALSGLGDIWNPVANAVAGIRYSLARYGSIGNIPGIRSMGHGGRYVGYAKGTNFSASGHVVVGEDEPELIQTPDGRWVLATKPTSFDDFMAGSKVTPLSQIPHYANGILAKAKAVVNGVGNPALSGGIKLSAGNGHTDVHVNIDPITVNSVMDGKLMGKTLTDIQNKQNTKLSRLRGVK